MTKPLKGTEETIRECVIRIKDMDIVDIANEIVRLNEGIHNAINDQFSCKGEHDLVMMEIDKFKAGVKEILDMCGKSKKR